MVSVKAALRAAEAFRRSYAMAAVGPLCLLALGGVVAALGALYSQPAIRVVGVMVEVCAWVMASAALMRVAFADDHPGERAFRPGRWGFQCDAQEGRYVAAFVLVLLATAACFCFPVLMAAAAGILVNGWGHDDRLATDVVRLGVVVGVAAAVYMGVRLSLARAASIDLRRVDMGFRLTKGRFWAILAAFMALLLMLFALLLLIGVPLGFIAGLSGPAADVKPRVAAATTLVGALVAAGLQVPLQVGLEAYLYRALRPGVSAPD